MVELTKQHYTYMNIGKRYWGADIGKATAQQRAQIATYVSQYKRMIAEGIGLFICGPNGTGKTYLSAALLNFAWSSWRVTGYCVTASELKQSWIKDIEAHSGSEDTMSERTEKARILLIDDIGKEHRTQSGFSEAQFGQLLRFRCRHKLTTFITANMNPRDFGETYGESSKELLKECMVPILLGGENIREIKAKNLRHNLKS